jgi:peroxiredoxin
MKNNLIIVGILALGIAACKGKKNTILTGTIEGLPNTEIRIASLDSNLHLDTVIQITDGKLNFTTNKITEPSPIVLNIKATNEVAFVFAEPGTLTFTATTGNFAKLSVKGSKTHTEFEQYQNSIAPLLEKGKLMTARGDTAKSQIAMDLIMAEALELDSLQGNSIKAFVKDHSTSPVSSFLIFTQLDRRALDFNKTNEFYSLLKGDALNTFFGKQLTLNISKLKNLSIGAEAPTFVLPDANGKEVNSASFKGKYVLLDFWASWCQPCRQENPNVVQAYAAFKDKGFEILGVSLDENAAKWKSAIADDKLTWTNVSDLKGWESVVTPLFNISSIPNNYLLDKQGKIIAIGLRGPALQAKLQELLP